MVDSLRALLNSAGPLMAGLYEGPLREYGVDSEEDLDLLKDEDWKRLGVKPLHQKRILMARDVSYMSVVELEKVWAAVVATAAAGKPLKEDEEEHVVLGVVVEQREAEERREEEAAARLERMGVDIEKQRAAEVERERKARLVQEEREKQAVLERERARQAELERERLIKEERLRAKREVTLASEESLIEEGEDILVAERDEQKEKAERAERKRLEAQRLLEMAAERERKRLEKEEKAKKKALERAKATSTATSPAPISPAPSTDIRVRKKVAPPLASANNMAECREWMLHGKCSKMEAIGINPADVSTQKLKQLQASGKGKCETLHRLKYRGCLMEDTDYWAMIDGEGNDKHEQQQTEK